MQGPHPWNRIKVLQIRCKWLSFASVSFKPLNPSHPPATNVVGGIGAAPLPCRRVSAAALLGGARELHIEHAGALYRLRITRQDKLILTK